MGKHRGGNGDVLYRIIKEARDEIRASQADPWRLRLEGLRGKKWDDGIERISTQTVFDILDVPHGSAIDRSK